MRPLILLLVAQSVLASIAAPIMIMVVVMISGIPYFFDEISGPVGLFPLFMLMLLSFGAVLFTGMGVAPIAGFAAFGAFLSRKYSFSFPSFKQTSTYFPIAGALTTVTLGRYTLHANPFMRHDLPPLDFPVTALIISGGLAGLANAFALRYAVKRVPPSKSPSDKES